MAGPTSGRRKVTRYDYTLRLRWWRGLPGEAELTDVEVDGSTAKALMIEVPDAELSTDDPGAPENIGAKVVFLDATTPDPSGADVKIVDGEIWITVNIETANLVTLSQTLRTETAATIEVTTFGDLGEGRLRFNGFQFKPDGPA